MKTVFVTLALCLACTAFASPGHHEMPAMPKEFDQLKALVGTWEGTTNMGQGEEKMTVSKPLTIRDMGYEYVWPQFSHATSLITDPSTVSEYVVVGIWMSTECLAS